MIILGHFLFLYKNICCGYSLEVPQCTHNICGENYSSIISKYSSLTSSQILLPLYQASVATV